MGVARITAVGMTATTLFCGIASNFGDVPAPHQIAFGLLAVVSGTVLVLPSFKKIFVKKSY